MLPSAGTPAADFYYLTTLQRASSQYRGSARAQEPGPSIDAGPGASAHRRSGPRRDTRPLSPCSDTSMSCSY